MATGRIFSKQDSFDGKDAGGKHVTIIVTRMLREDIGFGGKVDTVPHGPAKITTRDGTLLSRINKGVYVAALNPEYQITSDDPNAP
jgi:hypothetical protein